MNTDKCKECNSTSLEKCLKIQCPYFMNIKRDKNEGKDLRQKARYRNENNTSAR